MDILFPAGNEDQLKKELSANGISDYIFAYADLSKPVIVLNDKLIDSVGINKLKNTHKIIYDAKYSSKYLLKLLRKKLLFIVFGLEWHNRKDTLRTIDGGITPEIKVLLKDVRYGFCISDIVDELNKSPKILPRLAQNAKLTKKILVFSGKRVFSDDEKRSISNIFIK